MLKRWIDGDLITELNNAGMGAIAFTALAQGLLTNRYLDKPAADVARATERPTFDDELVTDKVHRAAGGTRRNRQAAGTVAGAIGTGLGAARSDRRLHSGRRIQRRATEGNLGALDHLEFTPEDLSEIHRFASDSGIDLWRESSDL